MDFKLIRKDLTKDVAIDELEKIFGKINLEWEGAEEVVAIIEEAIDKVKEI